ncbi:MAG: PAS domain-containing protein [Thalassobaculaceae bacterium]|nr:PAS domain-containing protein [Thalassobaculaceae bacterium]
MTPVRRDAGRVSYGAEVREGGTPVEWRYTMCPLDTDFLHFGPFRGLVAQWRMRIRKGEALPRRDDFQFEDFADWLGRIFIAKVEREPFNLRFTLWGVKLVEWWRVDYTNRTLGELSSNPDLWQMTEIQYFAEMDRAPFIGLASGFLSQHGRAHIKVLGLDLPFSDGDGLTHVISTHMKIDLGETIEDVLPDCPVTEFSPTV